MCKWEQNINNIWQDFCYTCLALSNKTTGHKQTNEHKDFVITGCVFFFSIISQYSCQTSCRKKTVVMYCNMCSMNTGEDLLWAPQAWNTCFYESTDKKCAYMWPVNQYESIYPCKGWAKARSWVWELRESAGRGRSYLYRLSPHLHTGGLNQSYVNCT